MKWENTATGVFVAFLFVWVYTRHFIFGWILYSLWFELPQHLTKPGWDHVTGYYFTDGLWMLFSIALCALQGLMIYWFGLLLRVAYRVLSGSQIGDPTDESDDESEEEEIKNGADVTEKINGKKSLKVNGTNGHVQKEMKKEK